MYYYKLFYKDGTWTVLDAPSKVTLSPADICQSCIRVQPISKFRYYCIRLIDAIRYFNQ